MATARYDWSLGLINAKTITGTRSVPGAGTIDLASRGARKVEMEMTAAGEQVFADVPRRGRIEFAGGPVLSPADRKELPEYVSLAVFRTEVWKHEAQRGTMVGTPAIIARRFGKGRVIIFSAHPEASEGLESLVVQAARAAARARGDPDSPKPADSRAARAPIGDDFRGSSITVPAGADGVPGLGEAFSRRKD